MTTITARKNARSRTRGTRAAACLLALVAIVATVGGIALAPSARAAAATGDIVGAVTKTATVTRDHLNSDGTDTLAAKNTVTLKVAQTQNLRGRQQVTVTWSGAHPTGGLWPDENSSDAAKEEYPFVLLECRGVESASKPLDPSTCWTQTWAERFQASFGNSFPEWRLDRFATPADRTQFAGQPDPRPTACLGGDDAERWVPFVAETGTVFNGGSQGCAGMAPESANVGGGALPSNTTYGITASDGTGTAQFDVWTTDENASLGCSYKVACSLVAIPIMGLSCDVAASSLPAEDQPPAADAAGDDAACRSTGVYAAEQSASPGIQPALSVTGSLWWSASNWRNRLAVPLTFAQPSSICDVVSSSDRISVYGSEPMAEATGQWTPAFCTNPKLFRISHVQTAEPEARSLLGNGTIDAAFSSEPPDAGFSRPIVQAPVAMTGFAISYVIDDAKGEAYHSLKLTPRLLAKLVTQSYPGDELVKSNYPALAKNPLNLTTDPEFVALNPGLPTILGNPTASVLLAISSDSDLVYSLTAYINANPEARAWLNGTPDPWGMVVNPNYRRIALPVSRWTLADTWLLPKQYIDDQINLCYSNSPTPYLGLIADPVNTLAASAEKIEFALSNVDTACPNAVPGDVSTLSMSTLGRQQPGHRFMLALTTLGEVSRYQLEPAALQTAATPPAGKFSTAAGRSFVVPTNASLKATGSHLLADPTTHTWPIPYAALAKDKNAYPGAMLVYLDVPTRGLAKTEAGEYATLLRFAATTGQTPGLTNGTLPGGYLPLTKANGLAQLVAYTQQAAVDVAAQNGGVAPVKNNPGQDTSPAVTGDDGSGSDGSGGGTGDTGSEGTGSSGTPAAKASPGAYPSVHRASLPTLSNARTVAAKSALAGGAVPIIALVGLVCLALAMSFRILPRVELPSIKKVRAQAQKQLKTRARALGSLAIVRRRKP
jgi:hypothetical protein